MLKRLLIIFGLFAFLVACEQTAPPAPSNDAKTGEIDHLIRFDSDGYASLRGRISGSSQCPGEDGMPANILIELEVPVMVQGIETYLTVPFQVEMQTELHSSLTPAATAQDFFTANPDAGFIDAFALFQAVEIRFTARNNQFLASAVREIGAQDTLQAANLEGIFTVNPFSQGTLEGVVMQMEWKDREGRSLILQIGLSGTLHGAPVSIFLPVSVTPNTQSVFKDGQTVPTLSGKKDGDIMPGAAIPDGVLRVEFKRKGNILEVSRLIEVE